MRIAHVSDTHLSADPPHERAVRARALWPHVLAALRADAPDLVVHTGDLVFDDPDRAADRDAARRAVDDIPGEVLVVPGNHDLGDHRAITDDRRTAYRHTWGPDRWVEHRGGRRLIGFDSLLLGSGLAAEQDQWTWLQDVLATPTDEPTLVFCHQPLLLPSVGDAERWAVPPSPAREQVVRLLTDAPADIVLIAGGHIHRHRDDVLGGLRQVTAPSAAFAVPELASPTGPDETGYLRYVFDEDEDEDRPGVRVERRVVHSAPRSSSGSTRCRHEEVGK